MSGGLMSGGRMSGGRLSGGLKSYDRAKVLRPSCRDTLGNKRKCPHMAGDPSSEGTVLGGGGGREGGGVRGEGSGWGGEGGVWGGEGGGAGGGGGVCTTHTGLGLAVSTYCATSCYLFCITMNTYIRVLVYV